MARFERRLKVSKTDAFELDVSDWAAGEAITSHSVTVPGGEATVGTTTESSGIIKALLTGVSTGGAEVHFTYATATRSDCSVQIVVVIPDC